ncbi:arsenosugar biosynthesis radical SAM (seleno)protein ArsS [Candidatus Hydrogenedentota bacterium]
MTDFESVVAGTTETELLSLGIDTIQVNVGFTCNQQCRHCHVDASPSRTESMEWETMELVLAAAREIGHPLIDITGGAPELNGNLRRLIEAARSDGHDVQVRTNLTVLLEPGQEDTSRFFRDTEVRLVASLPCYLEENVTLQRGDGTYARSIESIRRLNALGFGKREELQLDFVYNPVGPLLPPDQAVLEIEYRNELESRFGVFFSRLITITNMPVGRFGAELRQVNQGESYLTLLKSKYNPETLDGLMCRRQFSVGWDGTLYDCDFNLALGLPLDGGDPNHISHFDRDAIADRRIQTGDHCFACTAGAGSSCSGALA